MKKVKIEVEVTGCHDCPFLKSGEMYDMYGAPDGTVYYCDKDVFGRSPECHPRGAKGKTTIPKYPPTNCPYFKSDPLEIIVKNLGLCVTKENLQEILDEYNLKIVDK